MTVKFIDRGYSAKCPPNPDFPNGMEIRTMADIKCEFAIPYPAKRCGYWFVECNICKTNALITCAGRVDDVKLVQLECKISSPMLYNQTKIENARKYIASIKNESKKHYAEGYLEFIMTGHFRGRKTPLLSVMSEQAVRLRLAAILEIK